MPSQKTQRVELADLVQGDVVWSSHFQCYLIFQDEAETEDCTHSLFKKIHTDGYVLIRNSEVFMPSGLMKELL